MKNFKDNDPNFRREKAVAARQANLAQFREKPRPDSPEMLERAAARRAIAEARDIRQRERAVAKKAQQEREAAELAARKAAEAIEAEARKTREVEEAAQLLIELKAARDARYAARKKRKK